MLKKTAYILPSSGHEASCLDISLGPQKQALQKCNSFLGVCFPKAEHVPLQQDWKICCVSTPAMPVHICIFLTVFLEISTPWPDLG